MSVILKISGKKWSIPEMPRSGNGKVTLRPGGWLIAESETGERRRLFFFKEKGKISFSLAGRLFVGEWIEKTFENQTSGAGSGDLVAQFPGKVRKILVQKGATVLEGDSLLIVEAMKMEFVVRAPFAGKIKEIFVAEGGQVSVGVQFVEITAGDPNEK